MRLLFFVRAQGCMAVAVVCATTVACAGSVAPAGRDAAGAGVEAVIGDAACESDAQCRTVGVGAKACGGPQSYLAWSIRSTDATAVARAAERSARDAEAAAAAAGILSTCRIVTDPGAHCVRAPSPSTAASASAGTASGRCQLRTGARTGTAGRAD